MSIFNNNDIILFQGDSITDSGRDRETDKSLGSGYPMMIGSWYSCQYPKDNARFIKRGIGGS